MKQISMAVILFLTVIGSTYANRNNETPSFKGAKHFIQAFPQATEVNYKVKGDYTEVNFIWNGLQLQAFYDKEGNPVGTSRQIDIPNLPLSVQISLKKQYPGCTTTEAIEFDNPNDGLSYYVTAVESKATYVLRVSAAGEISVFKKMKH